MAYWVPQPGPQTRATQCPCDVILMGGTRGGGKSESVIGRHILGADRYGRNWNGLIIRRKYKEFNEIRRRIDALIAQGLPAERIGGDQQINHIRFKNGADVIMAAIMRPELVNDWVGHQFCVAKGTPIKMANGSARAIEDIRKGDKVQTLEGPRAVEFCVKPRLAHCVKASTPYGSQVHPVNHRFLTGSGWQSYVSILETYYAEFLCIHQGWQQLLFEYGPLMFFGHDHNQDWLSVSGQSCSLDPGIAYKEFALLLSQEFLQLPSVCCSSVLHTHDRDRACQDQIFGHAQQSYASGLGNCSIKTAMKRQESYTPLSLNAPSAPYKRHLGQCSTSHQGRHTKPNQYHEICKFYEPSSETMEDRSFLPLDHLRLLGQFQLLSCRKGSQSIYDGGAYGQNYCEIPIDYQFGYHPQYRFYGEQLHRETETGQGFVQQQDDAAIPNPDFPHVDGQGSVHRYIHPDVLCYKHPYGDGDREVDQGVIDFSSCVLSPFGMCEVYDLTVKGANHYISENSSLVNSNSEISIDECTTFGYFSKMVDKLRGSLRSPSGIECHMFATGNPGGPGHMQVKDFFKLGSAGLAEGIKPYDVFKVGEESRVFIPSFLHENKILWENDPKYVQRLMSISDPALRRAWIMGDWDVFIGQAFNWSPKRHTIPDFPVPDYVPIVMTFDWGYGAPFSLLWFWVDPDGRLYLFKEWYGWNGTPNEGLRLEDSKIAEGILEREQKWGISDRVTDRLAGPDSFNKKPNYQGGGQGPSTAEVFRGVGIKIRPGDPSRHLKLRQFRERLKIPDDPKEMPMMIVYESCTQFIRTIPPLAMDEDNPEYLDSDQELHSFDSACHVCMSRPLTVSEDKIQAMVEGEIQKQKRKELTPAHQQVWNELDEIRERMAEMQEN